ncbi:MAG: phenylpropionate dioxygenase [Alphaproteobacteria bacterium]|jgi:3-phenylpropionate/cinnamic acid dioxygenase small subunit|nr:phenylpropionate dioxygenase [Alphaproteobacteria bacterium]
MSGLADMKKKTIRNFLYVEAELLDNEGHESWLDLLTEDFLYWMPLEYGQTDDRLMTSLMHDDKLLLTVRIERLQGDRTFSQKPRSRCHHLLQRPQILSRSKEGITTRTAFHYIETRIDDQMLMAGWAEHQLVAAPKGAAQPLMIRRKTVRLMNPDAAFPNIQLIL